MSQATEHLPITIPSEVLALAAEQRVANFLQPVLEVTRRVFPDAALRVQVEDDPEIACDRHIVVVVDEYDAAVEQALEARYLWHREVFACCPASLVCVFRLGLELGR